VGITDSTVRPAAAGVALKASASDSRERRVAVGYCGDRIDRMGNLIATLMLMGIGIFVIAFSSIIAGYIFVCARITLLGAPLLRECQAGRDLAATR
jgi:hypothetical protein